jgi:prepilin-type processing-associated H-X9-DG protein
MRNRNELFVVIATVVILAVMVFSVLGTGCSGSMSAKAKQTICENNLELIAKGNAQYSSDFLNLNYVTPIAWGDGVNIWPAIVWNSLGKDVTMPYEDYDSDKDKWLSIVKESGMFECPADKDSASLPDSPSDMPKLSYAINRSAVRNMKSSSEACNIPNGPVLKTTKFKIPSQMIYVADTSWNKGSAGANAPGRLYSTQSHPSYGIKPGSICHHWDQGQLAPEFNGGSGETQPWHTGKSWNYSFIDGHVENLRPEQTIKAGKNIHDREPSGYWTWNQEVWGADAP